PATGSKRGREDDPSDDAPRPSKKAKGKAKAKAPRTSAQRRRDRKDPDHLTRDAVEEDEKGLQAAMNLHINCLWGIFSATQVPEMPTPAQVAAFQRRFTTTDAWEDYYKKLTYNSTEALAQISALRRDATLRNKSPIARNIVQMEDNDLHTMFVGVLSAGLRHWRPDVVGETRESVYNRAHELVAIKTFQDCATNHAYIRLSPDLTKINDRKLLQKLYR
ncbi:hypothetical protein C8R46DRAFT_846394, partial [Mycena filopes]